MSTLRISIFFILSEICTACVDKIAYILTLMTVLEQMSCVLLIFFVINNNNTLYTLSEIFFTCVDKTRYIDFEMFTVFTKILAKNICKYF